LWHYNWAVSAQALRTMAGAGQTVTFLDSAKFREQTLADYKFKGEIIRRLGLEAN
jgi:hypothetical protein